MLMIHLDLFAGIGGFSLAVDMVWKDAEHIFVEIDHDFTHMNGIFKPLGGDVVPDHYDEKGDESL